MMIGTGCRVLLLSLALGLFTIGAATAGLLPKSGEAQYELEFWESIKNSTHAEDYKAYLQAYPDGRFARLPRPGRRVTPNPALPPLRRRHPSRKWMSSMRPSPAPMCARGPPRAPNWSVALDRGDRVHVTGRTQDKNWFRIELAGGGTGFVYRELIREPVAPTPIAGACTGRLEADTTGGRETRTGARPNAGCGARDRRCHETATIARKWWLLQPGSFIMGDDQGDRSERPAHRVTISKPYAIGKYEVTLAQWNACVQAEACKAVTSTTGSPDKSPARDISWTDAQRYVQWLSKQTGQNYRLPTEAEWEYAARAGTSSRYWWGEKMASRQGQLQGLRRRLEQ